MVESVPSYREVEGLILGRVLDFFSFSILSNVSLNRSLGEVQHYCSSFKNKSLAWGKTSLISSVWDLKNVLANVLAANRALKP